MRQTIVSVVLPVDSDALPTLEARIEHLRPAIEPASGPSVLDSVMTLHFLSMMAFGPGTGVIAGNPAVAQLFVLEANFDGRPGPFWSQLEAVIGEEVRELLRCCVCPNAGPRVMFQAVTQPFSRAPVAPLLERCAIFPAASHRGNRGLSRQRIVRHQALFARVQALLPASGEIGAADAAMLHARLRRQLVLEFPWVDAPWRQPIPAAEYVLDWAGLTGLFVVTLVAAALPWLLLGTYASHQILAVIACLAASLCFTTIPDVGDLLTLFGCKARPRLWLEISAALLTAALACAVLNPGSLAGWIVLTMSGAIASLSGLVAALRWRERRDPAPPDAMPDPALLRALETWEGSRKPGADHMGSVVVIKPGLFRAALVRFGMLGVTLFVRVTGKQGYLGSMAFNRSMRSIHFAHWSFVDGGARQMFLSNFDFSWESYLDDFIVKEHDGLTLAWGNGLGFPPPRYLALDGATHGRQFKAWARLSMAPTIVHYAAYPDLTVEQVVRQQAVAEGLSAPSLEPVAASNWAGML